MTKAEIATEIAKTTGIDKAAVVTVIEQFMTVVKDSLAHGENVYLRGFGSFIIKQRAQKTARNITKNTTLIVPAHNIPAFKPADVFKNEVPINFFCYFFPLPGAIGNTGAQIDLLMRRPLDYDAILQGSFSVKQIFVANFICIGNRYITDCILEDRTFPLSNVIALLLSCRP